MASTRVSRAAPLPKAASKISLRPAVPAKLSARSNASVPHAHPRLVVSATAQPGSPAPLAKRLEAESAPSTISDKVKRYGRTLLAATVIGGSALFSGAHAAQAKEVAATTPPTQTTNAAPKRSSSVATPSMNAVAEVAAAKAEIEPGDTAWILTSTALVLFMTIPGLALFYGGLVKQKNVLSILMQCFTTTCLMTLLWTAFGYSMAFSTGGMQEGVVNLHSFIGQMDKAFLKGVTAASVTGTIPEALWFLFQMTFAIITPSLMIGAFAERIKFSSLMVFFLSWATLVYIPVCHAVWSGPGAYFVDMGVLDFAGGTCVHIAAGVAALLACIMVGPRKQNEMTPHNLPMTMTGTSMLWVGWFGFNAGSAVSAGGTAAMAAVATQICAATAGTMWMLQDWILDGKPTMLGIATGAVAGLVGITPAAGFVGPIGAILMGISVAIICRFCSTKVKNHFGYDDSLDVFGVHGVGGLVGSILVGVFCHGMFGGSMGDVNIAKQVGAQTFAAVATAVYTLAVTWGLLKVVDATMGLRVSESGEAEGLDSSSHDEEAYVLP